MKRTITLIAGPTASGKSTLALDLAARCGGHIVNADSMQVYEGLRVLTARPDAAEMAAAPHHLYGHVAPAIAYSAGAWVRDVRALLERLPADAPLIFVGGTGLYVRALTEGLSPMPDVPDAIRSALRARLAAEGAPALHAELAARDPAGASMLEPGDSQRIVRALEVLEASGRPLADWQAQAAEPVFGADAITERWLVVPDRAALYHRIEARFDAMIDAGALDEVRALRALNLPSDRPAMKAIGVRELGAVLDGTMDEDKAIARAKTATRQYAKRQMTWFRNQLGADWRMVDTGVAASVAAP
ncbi:MAG: tRNA (adenosine(37)-N6)-dimethylallyltransferase MiaA [Roseitalea sp.]|jgi:tRNA dimethylallyltransferase|nr:tRNA (adenosine(37)-N6)-dimethylallyltransferase MiaA [Roseitalea sp.]MBO6722518.1 tRNA (adenosine(37)-N6)-dimethylallyltransferase MiaA [Roseitalea sp.]MBO6742292.1 tRNA (adenosine(37)-N6)-dimethylallyltransferase MiaA [Roseitalea sp.]